MKLAQDTVFLEMLPPPPKNPRQCLVMPRGMYDPEPRVKELDAPTKVVERFFFPLGNIFAS